MRHELILKALVCTFASLACGVARCDGGLQGRLILHGDAKNHVAERIAGATTVGVKFTTHGQISGVQACCPSYGNAVGALTLSIYPWVGDVMASRARDAIATRRFVDFADNAWLQLDFAPLPVGDYYAELSGGTEMVGVWKSRACVDVATSYLNGVRVEGSYEFGVTLVDCTVPFAGDAELYALLTAPSLAPKPAPAFEGRDLFADTWDAMDGLGRVLGDATTLPAPRARQAGIFYWTWHQGADVEQFGPINNAEILAADPTRADRPDDPAWGAPYRRHHWDKPLFGYYRSTDAWVSRRHAQLLSAAGLDNIVFDATNGDQTWMDSMLTLARTWSSMRRDGIRTPQFTFMLPFNENPILAKSILQLYRDVYRPGRYHELWYYWKGRPLIHANPRVVLRKARDPKASPEDRKDWLEILRFFTFRPLQPEYTRGPETPDEWCWLEVYPQHGCVRLPDGRWEFCAAGVAQNHSWQKGNGGKGLAAMNDRNVFGRAYVGPSESELKPGEKLRFAPDRNPRRNEPNRFIWGDNFAQQLDHALALDPDYLFVTGWNEWMANMFPEWMGRKTAFPDQYAPPFSRDIEPSEGVLKDHFYHQLVQGIRRYKGVRPQRSAGENPVYCDFAGDTTPRDAAGYGPIRYRDASGRNDIVECFVEHDAQTIVFKTRCAAPITPHTDPRWMRLFLSCGLVADDSRPNWEHFHFVVNRASPPDAHTAVLESCTGGWNWKEIARVPMTVAGDTLTLLIPRAAIGQDGKIDVRFKWADNTPGDTGDVLDFYRIGDAAPDARFLYRYFEKDLVDLIDPLTGAVTYPETWDGKGVKNGHGFGKTFPGATTPFGQVQLSPDTVTGGDNGPGYSYSHKTIEGFSFTHMSGIGWYGEFGNIQVMPSDLPKSAFSHDEEVAKAGYYRVRLSDAGVIAEATAAPRSGMLRFTYEKAGEGVVRIDLARRIGELWRAKKFGTQHFRMTGADTFEGDAVCDHRDGGWGRGAGKVDYHIFFRGRLSKTPTQVTCSGGDSNCVARLSFPVAAGEAVTLHVAIAFDGYPATPTSLDFDAMRAAARTVWAQALNGIAVEGGTETERAIFATALYHAFIDPREIGRVTEGPYPFTRRTVFSGWDVYRSAFPLYTLLRPDIVSDTVNSMMDVVASGRRATLPRWDVFGCASGCMIGQPIIPVMADAWEKGIHTFDVKKAIAFADASLDREAHDLRTRGYMPGSLSSTLEYAYAEWALGRLKELAGDTTAADNYRYASGWTNCWCQEVGWMRTRNGDGSWMPWKGREAHEQGTVESNPWQQGWFVPHDTEGFIAKLGGRRRFTEELETFFARVPADFTWNDAYNHPNEPCHTLPFLFAWSEKPELTGVWTKRICRSAYGLGPYGLCGNEDVGQMSAWYVLAAIGLHPLCPGDGKWYLTAPLFTKTVIRLDPTYYRGGTFTIETVKGLSVPHLNGHPLNRTYVTSAEIFAGGTLQLP